jgi:hypothetical protein
LQKVCCYGEPIRKAPEHFLPNGECRDLGAWVSTIPDTACTSIRDAQQSLPDGFSIATHLLQRVKNLTAP